MSHNRVITVVGLAVIALALLLSACFNEQRIREEAQVARETLEPIVQELELQEVALTETIEDPATLPEELAQAEEDLETVRESLDVATRALNAALEIEADPTEGLVNQTLQLIMPFVPEPHRLPVVLGGGIVASVIRQWQLRRAGRDIARGIQVAAESDAELKKRLTNNSGLIRMNQGALAGRLVDEAQGKKPARPI